MNRKHITIALASLTLLTAPLLAADDYKPVLGNLWVGTKLFDKTTHEFFGTVKSIDGKSVEVLVAKTAKVSGGNLSVYSVRYERSEITSGYVTK